MYWLGSNPKPKFIFGSFIRLLLKILIFALTIDEAPWWNWWTPCVKILREKKGSNSPLNFWSWFKVGIQLGQTFYGIRLDQKSYPGGGGAKIEQFQIVQEQIWPFSLSRMISNKLLFMDLILKCSNLLLTMLATRFIFWYGNAYI